MYSRSGFHFGGDGGWGEPGDTLRKMPRQFPVY